MKLISFNVNGLRAVHKKGALAKLFALSPDVLALQEIKCEVTQIPQDRFADRSASVGRACSRQMRL